MIQVVASPSRIFGACPAGYRMGDEMVIDGKTVRAIKGPICYVALSAFTCQVRQIQRGERVTNHLSCPGCGSGLNHDSRVIFVLSNAQTRGLSYKYSAYNWARIDGRATEASARYCELSWQLTQAGKYAEAEQAIEAATKHLKPTPHKE
jgi:uncharacterized repeat protein (TIGR04076 family)